jgi:hypothetical protein
VFEEMAAGMDDGLSSRAAAATTPHVYVGAAGKP